jgi:nucleoid DNA-binding protein
MVITEKQLLEKIAGRTGENPATVRRILNGMEQEILACLASAAPEQEIKVKLMTGLSLESRYLPARETINPKTKEKTFSHPQVRCHAKVTAYFNQKLNNEII